MRHAIATRPPSTMSAQPSRGSDADALAAMTLAERAAPAAGPAADEESDEDDALPLSFLFARGQAAHRALDGAPSQVRGARAWCGRR